MTRSARMPERGSSASRAASLGAPRTHYILPRVAAPLAALAALLIFRGTLDSPNAVASRVATMPVVVATKDMHEGAIIDRSAVAVARWPAGTQPWGAYTTIDSVANRVTRVSVY